MSVEETPTPQEIIERCERVMSHAWMVRTFIKHCEEVEEFPELMNMARSIFDVSRALETRIDDPTGYFRMLRKKLGRFGRAVEQFRTDAAVASEHMNFRQAVVSIDSCVMELREWADRGDAALARTANNLKSDDKEESASE